nr:MAG: ferritin-like domain-containing protein [Chloroflexota bacterium]
MKMETLRDLLIEELQDAYDAEHQILDALPKMKQAAKSSQLQQAFDQHLAQTREHVSRLEEVFQMIDTPAKRKPCKAMQGIIKEGEEMMKENADPDVRDAGLIASAQRVEHYEIAVYGTAMAYARQLGLDQVIPILSQTLNEEKQTDEMLSQLAESTINVRASQ